MFWWSQWKSVHFTRKSHRFFNKFIFFIKVKWKKRGIENAVWRHHVYSIPILNDVTRKIQSFFSISAQTFFWMNACILGRKSHGIESIDWIKCCKVEQGDSIRKFYMEMMIWTNYFFLKWNLSNPKWKCFSVTILVC